MTSSPLRTRAKQKTKGLQLGDGFLLNLPVPVSVPMLCLACEGRLHSDDKSMDQIMTGHRISQQIVGKAVSELKNA
jgi:hypothetical protein